MLETTGGVPSLVPAMVREGSVEGRILTLLFVVTIDETLGRMSKHLVEK